jgi:curved DNA-binding protein CbpA
VIKDQDHYKVLGVTPSASVEQIRAAYVYLLKRFHPDSSPGEETGSTGVYVQRVVAAYNTLKDPRRRAVYDAELSRLVQQSQQRRPLFKSKRRRSRIRFDPNLIFYVLILAAAVVGLQLLISGLTRLQREQSRRAETKQLREHGLQNLPTPARLEPVARLAGVISPTAANAYSRKCYADARRLRQPTSADPCIGFDTAFVYWHQTVAGAFIADPYFQMEALRRRATRAFSKLNQDEAMVRIASIRAMTFEALLRVARDPDELARSSTTTENQLDSEVSNTSANSQPDALQNTP